MKLQVSGFLDNSLVNGIGLRSVVFVSGCKHNCEGCQNKIMQDFNYGDSVEINEVFNRIRDNIPIIRGVTFSGGEPFEQAKALSFLAEKIKGENLNLWCYTGYTFEYILKHKREGWLELIKNLDILIDGKFEKDKMSDEIKYRGSTNQRIINVKKSLSLGKVCVLALE